MKESYLKKNCENLYVLSSVQLIIRFSSLIDLSKLYKVNIEWYKQSFLCILKVLLNSFSKIWVFFNWRHSNEDLLCLLGFRLLFRFILSLLLCFRFLLLLVFNGFLFKDIGSDYSIIKNERHIEFRMKKGDY